MSDSYHSGGRPPGSGTSSSEPSRDAREAMNEVGRQTDRLTDEAKAQAGNLRDQAASALSDAKDQVTELAGGVADQARGIVEEQKSAGAERLSGFAHAVHRAAGELEDEVPVAAEYVRDAAAGLESVSRALRQRSVDDIIGTLEDFARTQPVAFFSGAVVAGFALSRFLKSSADRRAGISRPSTGSRSYRGTGMSGMGAGMSGTDVGAPGAYGSTRPGAGTAGAGIGTTGTGAGTGGTGTGWTGVGALPGTDSGIRPGTVGLSGSRPGVATGGAGSGGPSGAAGSSGGQMASGDPGGISPQAPGFTPHPVEPNRTPGSSTGGASGSSGSSGSGAGPGKP